MLIYYIIFFIITVFAVTYNKISVQSKKQLFGFLGFFLVLFAGLRGIEVDKDSSTYFDYFKDAPSIDLLFKNSEYFFSQIRDNIEPSLTLIFSIVKFLSTEWFPVVIFLYALMSVSLKLYAINKISEFPAYSLLIYFSSIFLLQDMTQIRIAVASGFLLLCVPFIIERKLKLFLLFLIIAILFHYSSIVFAPFYFLNSKRINKTVYSLIIVVSIVLGVVEFNPFEILAKLNLGLLSELIDAQLEAHNLMKKMNIFNVISLFNVLLCLFFIINNEKFKNKYSITLIKIYTFSVSFIYFFSFSPVVAFRTSEVLQISQIILLPQMINIIKPRFLAEITIILISLLYLLNQVLVNAIMNPYVPFFSS